MRALDVTAAAVLRTARHRSKLTQRSLALRAGVAQSVIATYETGGREPSLATLAALVEASGISFDIKLGRAPSTINRIGADRASSTT